MLADVHQSDYKDLDGNLLWSEPMRLSRLDAPGDILIVNYVTYRVRKVVVTGNVQHVDLERMSP